MNENRFLGLDPQKLSPLDQVSRTYRNLRIGLFAIGMLLPLMLIGSDYLHLQSVEIRDSISSYYHSPHSLTRDLFVGNLFVIGIFLMLYRGYSLHENIALDIAGFLLTLVAVFPTKPLETPTIDEQSFIEQIAYAHVPLAGIDLTIHWFAAVGFFLAIAYVAIFVANGTSKKKQWERKYRLIYRVLGGAMLIVPPVLYFLPWGKQQGIEVFLVEVGGIAIFSCYWLTKTLEFMGTQGSVEAEILGQQASGGASGAATSK